jgi:hypothetical protein
VTLVSIEFHKKFHMTLITASHDLMRLICPSPPPLTSFTGMRRVTAGNAHVKDVRGSGLLVGIELDMQAGPVVDAARDMGVLAITAGKGDIVRLVPPLVLTDADISKAVEVRLYTICIIHLYNEFKLLKVSEVDMLTWLICQRLIC